MMTASELNKSRVSKRANMQTSLIAERLTSVVIVFWLSMLSVGQSTMVQSNYSLRSPDQRIEVRIRAADRLSYDVLLNGSLLLENSTLSMNINRATLGAQPGVRATKERSENKEIISPV